MVSEMPKMVLIQINEEFLDTELGNDAEVTVGSNNYTGKIMSIVNYLVPAPASTTVTLEGTNLKVSTEKTS